MENFNGITDELNTILNKVAKELNLKSHMLNLEISAQTGDGFLGEIYKVSILDRETNSTINLIIKKAPSDKRRREETCIEDAYKNEIYFYTMIIPTFKKFQQDHGICDTFNFIPKYIASVPESGKEMLALQDLTFLGYRLREKDLVLDEEHTKFIFETYGRFHALSFCLKDQRPEEYFNLTNSYCDILANFAKKVGFSHALKQATQQALSALNETQNDNVVKKFKIYVDQTIDIFAKNIQYLGNYSAILHGDCWSNNAMFKYQDPENKTNLEDVSLLDFQLIRVGTPVYDLSYFFYSGGSAKLFKKLDYYLNLYYQSFYEFCQRLGSNPEILLPREVLSQEWKIYSKFGMLMALILIKIKLLTKEQSSQVAEGIGNESNKNNKFSLANVNNKVFKKRVTDLIIHMYDIDAL